MRNSFFKITKKLLLVAIIFTALFCLPKIDRVQALDETSGYDSENHQSAEAIEQSLANIIEQLLNGLDLTNLQSFFDEHRDIFGENASLSEIITASLNGEYVFDISKILSAIFKIFMSGIKDCFALGITIFALSLLCGITLSLSSQKTKLNDVVFCFAYGSITILVFSETASCIQNVNSTISKICLQSESLFPLLLTLVSITGGNSSVSVLKPICVFINNGVLQIVAKILFPILTAICVLSVISCLNEKFSLKRLRDLTIDCFKWITGITVAVFAFFVTINGLGASVYDGISLRAIKYAVGNTIPIIGGFAKEGVDLVIASGILIKNAIGGVALTVIFGALVTPFISVLSFSLSLKLVSAIIQPFADSRICDLIFSFSKIITLLCVLLIMVFVVYFITVFLIICTQNQIMVA